MTTNFMFFRECPPIGASSELHLGLSGAGWRFQFRAHPTIGLVSTQAWKDFIASNSGCIQDEYGRPYSKDEFFEYVDSKQTERPRRRQELAPQEHMPGSGSKYWLDGDGYTFANYEFC